MEQHKPCKCSKCQPYRDWKKTGQVGPHLYGTVNVRGVLHRFVRYDGIDYIVSMDSNLIGLFPRYVRTAVLA
jgi:hypothetical protein